MREAEAYDLLGGRDTIRAFERWIVVEELKDVNMIVRERRQKNRGKRDLLEDSHGHRYCKEIQEM